MDRYLKYLKKNLAMTLGSKIKIGKVEKIVGTKTEEEIEEMRERGLKILETPITLDGTEIVLMDVKSGSLLYQIFEEFQEELVKLGIDFSYMQCMWFVWREMRMKEMLNNFELPIQEAIKAESERIEAHFFDEEIEEAE